MSRSIVIVGLALAGCAISGAVCETDRECLFEGDAAERRRRFDIAIDRYSRAIALGLDTPGMYNRRGAAYFKAGRIRKSIEDFDRAVEREPRSEAGHWQRGIAHYYAERYEDGKAQFELHQTVNPSDVENGVWHFLCAAKILGVEEARKHLLPITGDPRIPMTEVYQLFRGLQQPTAVLAAAGDDVNQLFYAHLYLGLYYEAIGEAENASVHIRKAAEEYPVGHYMWEVARVHKDLRGW